jgi:tetratricopeptide (TPR) repeat protein/transglutaminase-like putative cysteine protease
MIRFGLGLVAAAAWAGVAFAADKPAYGPAPAWVKPATMPAIPAASDGQPVRSLLVDSQTRVTAAGEDTYTETVVQVGSPVGLQALGTLTFPWNPDTMNLVIHKLQIIRGGQTIDLLDGGKAVTVLRRETNLERAMLDGWLTAAMEPSGLEVGDVLDIAMTYETADPLMKGHSQFVLAASRNEPIDSLRLRALWPKDRRVHWKALAGLPVPKLSDTPEGQELEIDVQNLSVLEPPKGAPIRFLRTSQVQFTDFDDWSQASQLMAPLYVKASTLAPDSPLRAEIAKIKAASPDPKVQAAAALHLVQDQVRYLFLGMDLGGYLPADADVTWKRRFGDCKGKTALLLSLLHELGIQAEPAFVNSAAGDGVDALPPSLSHFDHVIVRAVIGGKVYWLDGTRLGDRGLDDIEVPPFEWALPVRMGPSKLEPLVRKPFDRPSIDLNVRLDASAGLDVAAPAHLELVVRGDQAIQLKLQIESMQPQRRDQFLHDYWKKEFETVDGKTETASFDAATGEERFEVDGTARLGWKIPPGGGAREYLTDQTILGWRPDFSRPAGPDADDPFQIVFPQYMHVQETIVLPQGGRGFRVEGSDIDKTVMGLELKRHAVIQGAVFTVDASTRSLQSEVTAAEARASEATLRSLSEQPLYVQSPVVISASAVLTARAASLDTSGDHAGALAELERIAAQNPKAPEPQTMRSAILIRLGRLDEALKAADASVQAHPTMTGYLLRAELRPKDQHAAALADVILAEKLEPTSASPYLTLGVILSHSEDQAGALQAFDEAVRRDPGDVQARRFRSSLNFQIGRPMEGFADLDVLLAAHPADTETLRVRSSRFRSAATDAKSLEAVNTVLKTDPQNANALTVRCWSRQYLKKELGAGLDDCERALKIMPNLVPAQEGRGYILADLRRYEEAAKAFDQVVAADPAGLEGYMARGNLYALLGRYDDAIADYDHVVKQAPKYAFALGERAIAKLDKRDLDGALEDADKAIAMGPGPGPAGAYRAKGSVLAIRGKYEEALAAFDQAIKINPRDVWNYITHAGAASALGRTDVALADYDKAAVVDPTDSSVWYARGRLLATQARYAEAVDAYSKALALSPKNWNLLVARADAYHQQDRDDLAAADMEAMVALRPKAAGSYIALASFRSLRHDPPGALEALDDAQRLEPKNTQIAGMRAQVLKESGSYAEGLAVLDKALATSPSDAQLLNARCWYRATAGRGLALALADCDAAIKLKPDEAAYLDSRGLVQLRRAELDQSIVDYTAALKLRPRQAASLFGRAVARLRNGDAKGAQDDLAAARAADPKVEAEFAKYGVRPVPAGA